MACAAVVPKASSSVRRLQGHLTAPNCHIAAPNVCANPLSGPRELAGQGTARRLGSRSCHKPGPRRGSGRGSPTVAMRTGSRVLRSSWPSARLLPGCSSAAKAAGSHCHWAHRPRARGKPLASADGRCRSIASTRRYVLFLGGQHPTRTAFTARRHRFSREPRHGFEPCTFPLRGECSAE
jgi:hypothetical protein